MAHIAQFRKWSNYRTYITKNIYKICISQDNSENRVFLTQEIDLNAVNVSAMKQVLKVILKDIVSLKHSKGGFCLLCHVYGKMNKDRMGFLLMGNGVMLIHQKNLISLLCV